MFRGDVDVGASSERAQEANKEEQTTPKLLISPHPISDPFPFCSVFVSFPPTASRRVCWSTADARSRPALWRIRLLFAAASICTENLLRR